jgi:predicted short-subunit dehydrogenase-like oxidoreductase (DUF2520 family)
VTTASSGEHLWIIGAGRMGLAVGTLLNEAGALASLVYSGRRPEPPPHPLFSEVQPPARYSPALTLPDHAPTGVLIAVPDRSVPEVAGRLSRLTLSTGTAVLHLSGTLGVDALAPLAASGCSVGSLHPLASVAGTVDGPQRLRGAWFGVEGAGRARDLAERIVEAAAGQVLDVRPGTKPLYHAAAVFASNYVVVLLSIAERLMSQASVSENDGREALLALANGALANVAAAGPAAALTGPISRGDEHTIRLHLARLSAADRDLYSLHARQALSLAREQGLDPALAQRVGYLLGEDA